MRPQLICLTPVRNEAWVLDVFLKCTSLWADHIIIADQNSTDGSREIAKKYPKVILIENDNEEMHQAKTRKMLFEEGRKIPGSKVFIALDADEVFTGDFPETNDWNRIVNSKPGQLFYFKWANILKDKRHYWISNNWMLWAYHDDGTEFPLDKYIHEWRMPWPKNSTPEEIMVSDFKVAHLMFINERRAESKSRFYQCITVAKESKDSFVALYRLYNGREQHENKLFSFDKALFSWYEKHGIGVFNELILNEPYFWFDKYVIELLRKHGVKKFRYLAIWDRQWMDRMKEFLKIEDPRNLYIKSLHMYLRASQRLYPNAAVRGIDKILKMATKK